MSAICGACWVDLYGKKDPVPYINRVGERERECVRCGLLTRAGIVAFETVAPMPDAWREAKA